MDTSARTIFAQRTVRQLTRQWQLVGRSVEHTRAGTTFTRAVQRSISTTRRSVSHVRIDSWSLLGHSSTAQLWLHLSQKIYAGSSFLSEDTSQRHHSTGLLGRPQPGLQVAGCLVAHPSRKCFFGVHLRRRPSFFSFLLLFAFLANCHSPTDNLRVKWPSPR